MKDTANALTPMTQRLAVFGPAVIALLLGGGIFVGVAAAREGRASLAHSHEVIAALDWITLRFVDAETGVRGYYITGDSTYLDRYTHVAADVRTGLATLRALTADNPRQQRRLDTLESLSSTRLAILDSGVIARRTAPRAVSLTSRVGPPVSNRGKITMDSIRRGFARMQAEEERLLRERSATEAARTRLVIGLVVVGSFVAAIMALLTNGLVGRFATAQMRMANEVGQKNAALREQANQLAAANQAKMQFLTAMSHELRTPLNAIDGYASLIEMGIHGAVTADQASSLTRIRHNGRYLAGLINDILNFARLEAGQLELRMTAVPVNETLSSIESLIGPQASLKGVCYRYVPCDPAIAVHGDAERVQQVIINLVMNAIKFTDAAGTVTLSCDANDTHARFCVADTGRGIPADKLGTIFDPFVQVDRRLTTSGLQGAGLGLAISRDLVVQMGGAITVDSVVDRGATFYVTLPRVFPNAEVAETDRSIV
jgi:signal transduction histidine kinase